MKKRMLIIITIFMLVGCNAKREETSEIIQIETKEVEVTTNTILEKHFTNSKRSYADLDLKLPVLSGNYSGIEQINTYYNTEKYNHFYEQLALDSLESIESQRIESGYDNEEILIKGKEENYWQMAHYELVGQYGDFISFKGSINGGVGGVSWLGLEGDVFHLESGKRLDMKDLFNVDDDSYIDTLYSCLKSVIENDIVEAKKNGETVNYDYLMDASEESKKQLILSFDKENFYLSDNGLVIEYQKYVLGSGAAGVFSFTVPYNELLDILSDDMIGALAL